METKNEIWKDIKGYEGRYQVSNMGRVRSTSRGILHQSYVGEGYKQVILTMNCKYTRYRVHRLVAMAFVEGYSPEFVVNHKNEIKDDNRAINLEWCTRSYNTTYNDAHRKGRDKVIRRPDMDAKRKEIGLRLRQLRKAANLKIDEAASKAHISFGTLGAIESGLSPASFDTLESICNIYGKTIEIINKKDV